MHAIDRRRRWAARGAGACLATGLAWWSLSPQGVGPGVARPPMAMEQTSAVAPRPPAPTEHPTEVTEGDASTLAMCEEACPGDDAACELQWALDRTRSHPDDRLGWLIARFSAMRLGDEDRYRELLARQNSEAPTSMVDDPWRAWGQVVATHAPRLQEQGLRVLTSAGQGGGLAAHVLGVRACGIAGADFVACGP